MKMKLILETKPLNTKMKKFRVRWTIDFDKHLNALTMGDSPYYDEKFVNDIINEFGSIKKYKESEKWIKLKQKHYIEEK